MRIWISTLALVAVFLAPVAFGQDAQDRETRRVLAHIEKARNVLEDVAKLKKNAPRLRKIDRAKYFLRRARQIAERQKEKSFTALRAEATEELVKALNTETEIHIARKSLIIAQKRHDEVRKLDADNAAAKTLREEIARLEAEDQEVYDDPGSAAGRRIRGRRRSGVPLRGRGIGRRR